MVNIRPQDNNVHKAYSVKFNEHERGFQGGQGSQGMQIFTTEIPGERVVGSERETQPTSESPHEEIASVDNVSKDTSEPMESGEGKQGAEPRTTSPNSPASSPANSSSADESCDSSWECDGVDEGNGQILTIPYKLRPSYRLLRIAVT